MTREEIGFESNAPASIVGMISVLRPMIREGADPIEIETFLNMIEDTAMMEIEWLRELNRLKQIPVVSYSEFAWRKKGQS